LEGSRRAFSADFIRTLADDFRLHGRQAVEKVRKTPAAYLKVCALLVPREMKLEQFGGVKAMTDEQLERGIELIKEMLAKREAGANAKVIEGEAEVVPSLPARVAPKNAL
jgi:ketopantoate hydroxymethyltransferase